MRWRWIPVGLFVMAAAAAAAWGLWLWGTTTPEPDNLAPTTRVFPPTQKTPARPFSWTLASSQQPQGGRTDDSTGEAAKTVNTHATACSESEPCPAGSTCVDGTCVNGACLEDGGPSACTLASSCVGQMAGTACSIRGAEGACCKGHCIEPASWQADPANCGSCGHACAPGLACRQALCVDPATGSRPSWTCLDEGHACPSGSFCLIDACFPRVCTGGNDGFLCPLPAGQVGHCCGQACADLFEDTANCRACGVRCPEGQDCHDGECGATSPSRGTK
jgi:hypothetical protein